MLHAVLWINVVMFLVESATGIFANSTALFADSVDMLGDAIVYGFSLYVVSRGLLWQARAALLKGVIMGAFGIGVLVQVAVKIARGLTPAADVMGAVGVLALAANLFCLMVLWRRRDERHQHAVGLDLLTERRDRQRGRPGGRRPGLADQLAGTGHRDRTAGGLGVRALGGAGDPRRIARRRRIGLRRGAPEAPQPPHFTLWRKNASVRLHASVAAALL